MTFLKPRHSPWMQAQASQGSHPITSTSTHPLPLNGISQQLDHILAFHTTAPETFGPGNEGALGAEKWSQFSSGFHGAAGPLHTVFPCLLHLTLSRPVWWQGKEKLNPSCRH